LQHNGSGAVHIHDVLDDGLEQVLVPFVINPVLERDVKTVVLQIKESRRKKGQGIRKRLQGVM